MDEDVNEATDHTEAADVELVTDERQALFDANLAAFKEKMPNVYARLVNHKPLSELVLLDDGEMNVSFNGEDVFERGAIGEADYQHANIGEFATRLTINVSKVGMDPHASTPYHRVMDRVEKSGLELAPNPTRDDSYFLIIYGVGLAQHIERMVDLTKCRSLALIEPNVDFLYHSCFVFDWDGLITRMQARGRLDIYLTSVPEEAAGILRQIFRRDNPMCMDGTWIFQHYKSSIISGIVRDFSKSLSTAIMGLGFFQDEINMISQTYKNLETGTARMAKKVEKSADLPCFVIGNGPSLEKLLPFIKENADKVVIVSCGSALETLLDADIKPDFWVMMERADLVLELTRETARKHDLSDIRFIGSTTVFPGLPELFRDPVFFFRPGLSAAPLFATSKDQTLIMPDPLSANAGLASSLHLGFRELYLLGVDVGSRRQDTAHTPGGWYNRLDEPYGQFGIRVRGNFGGDVWTTATLQWSKESLESLIRVSRGRTVINLSDGALIEGVTPMHHKAVKLKALKASKESYIEKLYEAFPIYEKTTFDERWESEALVDNLFEFRDEMLVLLADMDDFQFEHDVAKILEPARSVSPLKLLVRGTIFTFCIAYAHLLNRIVVDEERDVLKSIMKDEFTTLLNDLCDKASEVFLDVEAGKPWTKSFVQ